MVWIVNGEAGLSVRTKLNTISNDGTSYTPDFKLLASSAPSGVAFVTFSSIDQTYTNLELIITGQTSASAQLATCNLTFNNDTGANYDYQQLNYHGSIAAAASFLAVTSNIVGIVAGATAPTNVQGTNVVQIPGYSGGTFEKQTNAVCGCKFSGVTDTENYCFGGYWRNVAAITRMDITLSTGNFVTGSFLRLYGKK